MEWITALAAYSQRASNNISSILLTTTLLLSIAFFHSAFSFIHLLFLSSCLCVSKPHAICPGCDTVAEVSGLFEDK